MNATRFVPHVVLMFLAIPFVLFLFSSLDGFRNPSDFTCAVLQFIIDDPSYAKAITYLQAPLLLAITLKYYSPVHPHAGTRGTVVLPQTSEIWLFLLLCLIVLIVAYLSRYLLGFDCGKGDCIRARLVSDLNLTERPQSVAALLEYCSVLVASSLSLITAVVVPAKPTT